MKLIHLAVALSLSLSGAIAQTLEPISSQPNTTTKLSQTTPRETLIGPTSLIFPHLAVGGEWSTTIVLLNMGVTPVTFTGQLYTQAGAPMQVTTRVLPNGGAMTSSSYAGGLFPGESYVLLLSGQGLQVGWSEISYDTASGRLGGYAIFRDSVPAVTDFEALVPLSASDDTKFFFTYDNTAGFVTSIALLNPSKTIPCTATLTFRDAKGVVILTDKIALGAGQQTAFALPTRYQDLGGKMGSVYVQGDTDFLSALGFRFNPKGALTTIPILRWGGIL